MIVPTLTDAGTAARLRATFLDHGYTEAGLAALLGSASPASPQLRNYARILDRARGGDLQSVLVRWFLAGAAQDASAVRGIVPERFLVDATASGLLSRRGDAYVPAVLVGVLGNLLLAYDRFDAMDSAEGFDFVLAVSPSARHLQRAALRRPCRTALDLGTGCGVLGLLTAAWAEEVVATDLSPRAVAFTAFNAALNGIPHVVSLTGDRFAPVRGRTFDSIICNPPFIIAPSRRFRALYNEMELDGFCRTLVREAPAHLNEGGYFQMVCEWVEVEGQPWAERLAGWFEGTGCDAWVLCNFQHEPSWYALTRLRELPEEGPEADAAHYAEWMEYYRSHGVKRVHGGLITMRRRSGANWLRVEDIPPNIEDPFGDALLAGFAVRDRLDGADDDALLAARFRPSPAARLVRMEGWGGEAWSRVSLRMSLAAGLRPEADIDDQAVLFISLFDGRRPASEVIAALAAQVGFPEDEVRGPALGTLRGLLEQGFLVAAT